MSKKATEPTASPKVTTDKPATVTIAREFILGEVMKAAMKQIRSAPKAWQAMKEQEQARMLAELQADVTEAIDAVVRIISSDNRVHFRAMCEKVAFSANGVKAALGLHNTKEAHALADAASNEVLIVIPNGAQYLGLGSTAPTPEKDQKALFDKSQDTKKDGANAGEAKSPADVVAQAGAGSATATQ